MKKQYVVPQAEIVNVGLHNSVLNPDGFGNWSKGAAGDDDGYADAKENNTEFEEESLINPTQPNIWGDDEE